MVLKKYSSLYHLHNTVGLLNLTIFIKQNQISYCFSWIVFPEKLYALIRFLSCPGDTELRLKIEYCYIRIGTNKIQTPKNFWGFFHFQIFIAFLLNL